MQYNLCIKGMMIENTTIMSEKYNLPIEAYPRRIQG